jgi:hypothetical protein
VVNDQKLTPAHLKQLGLHKAWLYERCKILVKGANGNNAFIRELLEKIGVEEPDEQRELFVHAFVWAAETIKCRRNQSIRELQKATKGKQKQ